MRCKPLVLHEREEYRIYRDRRANLSVEHARLYILRRPDADDEQWIGWSRIKSFLDYPRLYFLSGRKGKLELNKEHRQRGIAFIEHWKELVAQPIWEVRCENWDGLGTPCPIQIEKGGIQMCPVKFSSMGYSGGRSVARPCPDKCPGPLNQGYLSPRVCAPSAQDRHGVSMNHLAQARYKISHPPLAAIDDCACVLPEQSCPVCRAAARAVASEDEIPY